MVENNVLCHNHNRKAGLAINSDMICNIIYNHFIIIYL